MPRMSNAHVKLFAIAIVVVIAAAGCSSSRHASQPDSTTGVPVTTAVPTTVKSRSATGRIAGVFEFTAGGVRRAGQASPPVDTIVGTVTVISESSGRKWQTRSGLKGYSLAVPPGSYRVSGTGVGVGGKSRFTRTFGSSVVVAVGRTTAAPLIIGGY
jgi:hypothetical protein